MEVFVFFWGYHASVWYNVQQLNNVSLNVEVRIILMVIMIFTKTQSLNIFELFWERWNRILKKRYFPTLKPYPSIPALSDTDARWKQKRIYVQRDLLIGKDDTKDDFVCNLQTAFHPFYRCGTHIFNSWALSSSGDLMFVQLNSHKQRNQWNQTTECNITASERFLKSTN